MSNEKEIIKKCDIDSDYLFTLSDKTQSLLMKVINPLIFIINDNQMDTLNKLLIANFIEKVMDIPLLYNKYAADTSFALLRCPFELLVLIERLFIEPNKKNKINDDLFIINLKRLLALYKIDACCQHVIKDHYSKASTNLKERIKLTYNNNSFEYDEKFLNNYKTLSQQVRTNINFLKSKKSVNSDDLDKFKVIIYQISSDIIHGDFMAKKSLKFCKSKKEYISEVKHNLNLVGLMIAWVKNSVDEYTIKGNKYSQNNEEYWKGFNNLKKYILSEDEN